MTVRRWESWAVGTDNGEPFADLLGYHFTRLGAKWKLHNAIGSMPWFLTQMAARASGWELEAHPVVKRRA